MRVARAYSDLPPMFHSLFILDEASREAGIPPRGRCVMVLPESAYFQGRGVTTSGNAWLAERQQCLLICQKRNKLESSGGSMDDRDRTVPRLVIELHSRRIVSQVSRPPTLHLYYRAISSVSKTQLETVTLAFSFSSSFVYLFSSCCCWVVLQQRQEWDSATTDEPPTELDATPDHALLAGPRA